MLVVQEKHRQRGEPGGVAGSVGLQTGPAFPTSDRQGLCGQRVPPFPSPCAACRLPSSAPLSTELFLSIFFHRKGSRGRLGNRLWTDCVAVPPLPALPPRTDVDGNMFVAMSLPTPGFGEGPCLGSNTRTCTNQSGTRARLARPHTLLFYSSRPRFPTSVGGWTSSRSLPALRC